MIAFVAASALHLAVKYYYVKVEHWFVPLDWHLSNLSVFEQAIDTNRLTINPTDAIVYVFSSSAIACFLIFSVL